MPAEINAEKPMYPYGRCLSITLPNYMQQALSLELILKSAHLQIKSVRIFLQDQQKDIKFLLPAFFLPRKLKLEPQSIIWKFL